MSDLTKRCYQCHRGIAVHKGICAKCMEDHTLPLDALLGPETREPKDIPSSEIASGYHGVMLSLMYDLDKSSLPMETLINDFIVVDHKKFGKALDGTLREYLDDLFERMSGLPDALKFLRQGAFHEFTLEALKKVADRS